MTYKELQELYYKKFRYNRDGAKLCGLPETTFGALLKGRYKPNDEFVKFLKKELDIYDFQIDELLKDHAKIAREIAKRQIKTTTKEPEPLGKEWYHCQIIYED